MARRHEKLDVCRLSPGYAAWVYEKANSLNGVHRPAGDPWLRASQAIPLNIAEGNGGTAEADRRHCFGITRVLHTRTIVLFVAAVLFGNIGMAASRGPVFDTARQWNFEEGKTGGWRPYDNWAKPTLTVTNQALAGDHSLNIEFNDKSTVQHFDKGFGISFDPPIPWSEFSFLAFRYKIDGEVSHFRIIFHEDAGNWLWYNDRDLVIGRPGRFCMSCDQLHFGWSDNREDWHKMMGGGMMSGKVRDVLISLHNKKPVNSGLKFSFTVDDIVLGTDVCRPPFTVSWKETRPYLAVAARARRAISVDGKLDDWRGAAPIALVRRDQLACQARKWRGPTDLSALAALLWDEEYLYFAVNVRDDKVLCDDRQTRYRPGHRDLSASDSVRLYVRTSPTLPEPGTPLGANDYAFCASPFSPAGAPPRLVLCPYAGSVHKDFPMKSVHIASAKTRQGYAIEIAIPWRALKVKPTNRKRLGFFTLVDDSDRPGSRAQEIVWRKMSGQYWMDASSWGRALLTRALTDSEAICAAAVTGAAGPTTDRADYEMNQEVLCRLDLWWPLVTPPGKSTWRVVNSRTDKLVGQPATMPTVKTPLSTRLIARWNCGATEDGTYSVWCATGEPEKVSIEGRFQLIGVSAERRRREIARSKEALVRLQAELSRPGFGAPKTWLLTDRLHGRRGRAYVERVEPAKWTLAKDPVTWDDLDGQFQGHAQVGMSKRSLDTYFKQYDFGRSIKAHAGNVSDPNWKQMWQDATRRKLTVCDVWGCGWGPQVWQVISKQRHDALRAIAGRRFFGYEVGEQDGAYIGGAAPRYKPKSRRAAQKLFRDWTETTNNVPYHHYCVALGSLNFSHQYGAMGCYRMLGLEVAQGLPSDIMEWAFLRGAGKQYGLLVWNCISIYNRWGYKCYTRSGKKGYEFGPDKGTSLSLMKRLYYVSFLYGSATNGFEGAYTTTGKDVAGYPKLSPVGEANVEAVKWCRRHAGDRGVQYTPVALLIDFTSGWVPPRHLYTGSTYLVWGNMPYEKGDYQIDDFFRWIFPRYEDGSYFKDERGFLTATPFGDKFDVLTSDVHQRILDQYSVVCLLGELDIIPELAAKLKRFVGQGGDLIVSAAQAKALGADFCGVTVSGTMKRGYGSLSLADRTTFQEKEYTYCEMTPTHAKVLAASPDKLPLITLADSGAGRVIVIAPDYWMTVRLKAENDSTDASPPVHPARYEILKVVRHVLGQYFRDLDFVRIDGPEIQYIVNLTKDSKRLLVTLVNNSQTDWQGRVSLADHGARLLRAGEWMEARELPASLPIDLRVPKGDLRVIEITVDRALFSRTR